MQRYFLEIAYDGSSYHGWQVQPNEISVQEKVDDALRKIFRQESIQSVGCGRTDTGVHATQFYLHFDSEEILSDVNKELYRLNNYLPFDIACRRLVEVNSESHARFDATERAYEYRIHQRKDPFLNQYSVYVGYELDLVEMNKAGQILLSHKDFASFCKTGADPKTTLCDVMEASWSRDGEHQIYFHIRANRFLRNMVRAIVGTMLDVGRGAITLEQFREILDAKDRSSAGVSAPAHGLYLTAVKYPYL